MKSRLLRFSLVMATSLAGLGAADHILAASVPTRALALPRFLSCSSLKKRIVSAQPSSLLYRGVEDVKMAPMPVAAPLANQTTAGSAESSVSAPATPTDFSQTNVQVQGVDEADIVKQNGKLAFHLTKNRVIISRIAPATEAAILSTTNLEDGIQAQDLYLDGDRLVVIGSKWNQGIYYPLNASRMMMPIWRGNGQTVVQIWDVSKPEKPSTVRTLSFDGSQISSRMTGGQVYLALRANSNWDDSEDVTAENLVPTVTDSKKGTTGTPLVRCSQVNYFSYQPAQEFLAIVAIPTSGMGELQKKVILGAGETVYATKDALYVAAQDWTRQWVVDSAKGETDTERTNIYRFNLTSGQIRFTAKGRIAGHVLNQYAMDEMDGNLRVAATKGYAWNPDKTSTSNVYVLSPWMQQIGKLEGLAPGEQIFAVRFMGPRAYLVTFKNIDPFFAIDLANPTQPRLLGKLKIPGYSTFLQPIDANHILGIGKNAIDAPESNFAWYQGLKLAIFDVTDVAHPKQQWETNIGDRGTDSAALNDPHALLFSPEKKLLALPVLLAQYSDEAKKVGPESMNRMYGDYVFQGAYVYRVTLEKGFELLGKLSHISNPETFAKNGYGYGNTDESIERIQYAGDTLLTFSPGHLGLHHLMDLAAYKQLQYPVPAEPKPYPLPEPIALPMTPVSMK